MTTYVLEGSTNGLSFKRKIEMPNEGYKIEVEDMVESSLNEQISITPYVVIERDGSVVADICGEDSEEKKPPKHAYAFGDVGRLHKQIHEERVTALNKFCSEVSAGNFPYPQTNISMHKSEKT